MKLLLDTHSFIWFAEGDSRLSKKAMGSISDPKSVLFLNIGSCWEIVLKASIGKLVLSTPYEKFLVKALDEYPIQTIPVLMEDA